MEPARPGRVPISRYAAGGETTQEIHTAQIATRIKMVSPCERQCSSHHSRKEKYMPEENTKKFEHDLIGMNRITEFVRKSAGTIQIWRTRYGFPIHLIESDGTWEASRAEIGAWLKERSVKIGNISQNVLDAFAEKKSIADGTRPKFFAGKVLRNFNEIAELFKMPITSVTRLTRFSDFLIPDGVQDFEVSADDLRDYFDSHGISTGLFFKADGTA